MVATMSPPSTAMMASGPKNSPTVRPKNCGRTEPRLLGLGSACGRLRPRPRCWPVQVVCRGARRRLGELGEESARVGDHRVVGGSVPSQFCRLGVDLDDGHVRVELLPVAGAEVPIDAQGQQHVGLGKRHPSGPHAEKGVVVRQRASGARIREDGGMERLRHFEQRLRSVPPHSVARKDHRALAPGQQVGDEVDCSRIGPGLLGGSVPRRQGGVLVDQARLHVEWDVEEHGSASAAEGVASRDGDVVGQPRRLPCRRRQLRDRPEQRRVVHLLEAARQLLADEVAPTENEHRRVREVGVHDGRDRVRHPRCRSDGGHTEPTGEPRVCLGGVARRLFMPHVDNADTLFDAAIEYRHDVPAGEGEERIDAFGLERLGDQPASVDLGHGRKDSGQLPATSDQQPVTSGTAVLAGSCERSDLEAGCCERSDLEAGCCERSELRSSADTRVVGTSRTSGRPGERRRVLPSPGPLDGAAGNCRRPGSGS